MRARVDQYARHSHIPLVKMLRLSTEEKPHKVSMNVQDSSSDDILGENKKKRCYHHCNAQVSVEVARIAFQTATEFVITDRKEN